jgi:hypothetical protein
MNLSTYVTMALPLMANSEPMEPMRYKNALYNDTKGEQKNKGNKEGSIVPCSDAIWNKEYYTPWNRYIFADMTIREFITKANELFKVGVAMMSYMGTIMFNLILQEICF